MTSACPVLLSVLAQLTCPFGHLFHFHNQYLNNHLLQIMAMIIYHDSRIFLDFCISSSVLKRYLFCHHCLWSWRKHFTFWTNNDHVKWDVIGMTLCEGDMTWMLSYTYNFTKISEFNSSQIYRWNVLWYRYLLPYLG